MADEVKFVDAESYQGKGEEKLTFRMIVLETLKKIGTYASVEFRGGYWEERIIPVGNLSATQRIYIPDTREVYSNAIEYLYDLLYPHFDSEMKKAGEKTEKELDKAYKDNTISVRPDREDQTPEEAKNIERTFKDSNKRVSFRAKRRVINRMLFRELNCFLQRVKYMEGKSFVDEA